MAGGGQELEPRISRITRIKKGLGWKGCSPKIQQEQTEITEEKEQKLKFGSDGLGFMFQLFSVSAFFLKSH